MQANSQHAPAQPAQSVGFGFVFMIMAMALIPFGDGVARYLALENGYHAFFLAWMRFLLGALLIIPFLRRRHMRAAYFLTPKVLLRSGLIVLGITLMVQAVAIEELANVFGAFFIGPVVSFILSIVILKERADRVRIVTLLIGFLGMLLMVRPGLTMSLGMGLGLAAGCAYGAYLVANRWLASEIPPLAMIASQLFLGAILLAPFGVPVMAEVALWPGSLMVLMAATSLLANLFTYLAYQYAEATRMAPLVYTQLASALVVGFLMFGDLPDTLALIGLAIMLVSGLSVLFVGIRKTAKNRVA